MRKLLICLTLLLGISGSAAAEWSHITDNPDNTKSYYIDLKRIIRSEHKVKMWLLVDFKKLQNVGVDQYLSAVFLHEYYCKEALLKKLFMSWRSENMGNGKMVARLSTPSEDWEPIIPSSIGEVMWEYGCGK